MSAQRCPAQGCAVPSDYSDDELQTILGASICFPPCWHRAEGSALPHLNLKAATALLFSPPAGNAKGHTPRAGIYPGEPSLYHTL